MQKIILFVVFILSGLNLIAQSFSIEEKLQGYAQTEDKLTFIFDPNLYDVEPKTVFVTGGFRAWDSAIDNPDWMLKKQNELWTLSIDNSDFSILAPNTPFKFRIDNGEWLAPPTDAKNEKGGNLVFMQQEIIIGLKAELISNHLIWAEVNIDRPLNAEAYQIKDAQGNIIAVKSVLPNSKNSTLIVPAKALNKKRVYYLEIPSLNLQSICSFDGWFRQTLSTKELGANVKGSNTDIRLFAPRAEMVKLYLYKNKNDKKAYQTIDMKEDHDGVWEANFKEDLHGTYYDFTIHGHDDPGNHFYETTPVHITDPYARVSDDTWGKARIWRKTKPASPLKNGIPKMEDIIAYEVHIQDFTDRLPVDEKHKGTFNGMIATGLKNNHNEKIGFDYLLDLGINVVHLMPVQEYVHYPDAEWQASFKDDPYMIDQGVNMENYQWGYRTSHAMAVESRFRTKGKEPGAERDEFRDLVQAFHDNDIAVIIDIVPNHTAENMDGNNWFFNFNGIDKQYYYRTKDFEHIGAYGNEVKTENRPMTQRWLIDQCLHYIHEFGIDGFRIDLAGQIDEQTLKALKAALGADKIVYGEAWIGSNDPNFEENPDWDWYKEDSPITFFQDESRNAFKGPVFELNTKEADRGWPGGNFAERENVKKGLTCTFADDKTPLSGINYLDIHDNFALADQFGSVDFDGRTAVDQEIYKIAVTLLYTSLGPIVTHGGSEIMRSKAHAPLKEVVKETKAKHKVYMHGYRDTYNHRTANQFIWDNVGKTPDSNNKNDYKNMYNFWKGMNAFRLSEYGRVFRKSEAVPDDYYQWFAPKEENMLGYLVDNKILVLLNAGSSKGEFKSIKLPAGNWKLIADKDQINHKTGIKNKEHLSFLTGNQTIDVKIDPTSLLIWVKE